MTAPRMILLVTGLMALSACAPPPKPAPVQRTTTVQHPQPMPVQTRPAIPPRRDVWIDQPQTPGTWRWAMVQGKSTAAYASGDFAMVCDRGSGTVSLVRRGASAAPTVQMTVRTTGESRVLSAIRVSGAPPALAAVLSPRDSLLDAMAYSRGRFTVETAGLPPLYLPSWTEVSRVIEDCR